MMALRLSDHPAIERIRPHQVELHPVPPFHQLRQAFGGSAHAQRIAACMALADLAVLHHQQVQGIESFIDNQGRRFEGFGSLAPLAAMVHTPIEPAGYRLGDLGPDRSHREPNRLAVQLESVITHQPIPHAAFLSWPNILIRQAARRNDGLSCDCQ